MGIYNLLNKRTLKFKEDNIKFIAKEMGLSKIKAEEVYRDWKKYYINTSIDENSSFIRKVKNIETGEIFDTPQIAGDSVGHNRQSISGSCCSGLSAGGYHWEYVQN